MISGEQLAAAPSGNGAGALSFAQLESLWIQAGGDQLVAPIAAAIAEAEHQSANVPLLSAPNINSDGSMDFGVWQINSVHGFNSGELQLSPLYNAQAAVAVYKSQGFGAWTTFSNKDASSPASFAYWLNLAGLGAGASAGSAGGGATGSASTSTSAPVDCSKAGSVLSSAFWTCQLQQVETDFLLGAIALALISGGILWIANSQRDEIAGTAVKVAKVAAQVAE